MPAAFCPPARWPHALSAAWIWGTPTSRDLNLPACQGWELVHPDDLAKKACCGCHIFSPSSCVAPVTLGGKAGQVFEVLMMISFSKPAQTINGFEMLIRRRA